jgi:hypothetical protein
MKHGAQIMSAEYCACGAPLHYTNSFTREYMESMVKRLGENIRVQVSGRTWLVPRHYIALHGVMGAEIEQLAQEFGFPEVKTER